MKKKCAHHVWQRFGIAYARRAFDGAEVGLIICLRCGEERDALEGFRKGLSS